MSPLQERAKKRLLEVGEPFEADGTPGIGVFAILGLAQARNYLPASAVDQSPKPMHSLTVPFDDVTAQGASIAWSGDTTTVLRVVPMRVSGETVAKFLILGQEV